MDASGPAYLVWHMSCRRGLCRGNSRTFAGPVSPDLQEHPPAWPGGTVRGLRGMKAHTGSQQHAFCGDQRNISVPGTSVTDRRSHSTARRIHLCLFALFNCSRLAVNSPTRRHCPRKTSHSIILTAVPTKSQTVAERERRTPPATFGALLGSTLLTRRCLTCTVARGRQDWAVAVNFSNAADS